MHHQSLNESRSLLARLASRYPHTLDDGRWRAAHGSGRIWEGSVLTVSVSETRVVLLQGAYPVGLFSRIFIGPPTSSLRGARCGVEAAGPALLRRRSIAREDGIGIRRVIVNFEIRFLLDHAGTSDGHSI